MKMITKRNTNVHEKDVLFYEQLIPRIINLTMYIDLHEYTFIIHLVRITND